MVVEAPQQGMQQIHQGDDAEHPAAPADDAALCHNDHHKACQYDHGQRNGQQLPQQKFHGTGPACQNILEGTDYVRIDHVDQCGEPLTELLQHPGKCADDGSHQITEPIFQRKRLLKITKRL